MKFLDRLERNLSWIAIPGLIRFVVLFNALVFVLHLIAPGYESLLTLNRTAILEGQLWRLVTWIFIPETFQPFWIFFALLFLWFLGDGLESSLGTFRTTLFYLLGMISCTVVALIFGSYGANTFLNLSLLYAFATLHPHYKVLFLFVIPLSIGWLALASAFLTVISSLAQPPAARAALIITLFNYLLFFGPILLDYYKKRKTVLKGSKIPFLQKKIDEPIESLHQCKTCHRTEQMDPDLLFRVSKNGEEYCMEHLPKV